MESDIVTAWVKARIKGYNGLPRGSPTESSYFDNSLHTSDRYSIGFSFVPKKDIPGTDMVMGFDYDHSIKHQLPPGFRYAMRIVTTFLDPGLYSDPYCDEPYVYGPALSSFFAFRIGEQTEKISTQEQLARLEKEADGVVEEGADGSGEVIREEKGMPTQWKKRRKHFLDAKALAGFTFEKGRMYHADFFNPYIDFANFALILPGGFSISVAKYIDEKTHHLRFVLKNRKTEEVFFVVLMKLLFGKELENRLQSEKRLDQENSHSAEKGLGSEKKLEQEKTQSGFDGAKKEEDREYSTMNGTRAAEASVPSQPTERSVGGPTHEEPEDEGSDDNDPTAAQSLANSIYGVYAALGFTNPSSSESEASSREISPKPSKMSLDQQIDDMDDATVESFLKNKHSSAK